MEIENKCPVCGEPAEFICKCPRMDSTCKNKHSWHHCPIHRVVQEGQSDHSTDTFSCTCKFLGKDYMKQRLLNAMDYWVHAYAPEFCDAEDVRHTYEVMSANGGTLMFINQLKEDIKRYFSQDE